MCVCTAGCAPWASGNDAAPRPGQPPPAGAPHAERRQHSRRALVAVLIGFPVVVHRRRNGGRDRGLGSSCDQRASPCCSRAELIRPAADVTRRDSGAEPHAGFARTGSATVRGRPLHRGRALPSTWRVTPWGCAPSCGRAPGRFAQGSSTITRELVRNLYLARADAEAVTEACLAIKLSRQWSKDGISRRT